MNLHSWLEKESQDLYRRAWNIRAEVEPMLKAPLHRDYTDHSIDHSLRIIEKLGGLTDKLMETAPLSPIEVFILLAAAYLHDLGMQDERSGSDDHAWIRDQHHVLSSDLILQSVEHYSKGPPLSLQLFPDEEIGDIVARVVEGHRGAVDHLKDHRYDPSPYGSHMIRPRLLAALLRFADELDTDFDRAPRDMLTLRSVRPESLFHWYKCYYVKAVVVRDEFVEVWYRFPEDRPDYDKIIVPIVQSKMDMEFAQLQAVFRAHGIKLGLGAPQVVSVRGLQHMPAEVEQYARELCIGGYIGVIRQKEAEIRFIESPSAASREISNA